MDIIISIEELLNIILRNVNLKTYINFSSTCRFLQLTPNEIAQLRINYLRGLYFDIESLKDVQITDLEMLFIACRYHTRCLINCDNIHLVEDFKIDTLRKIINNISNLELRRLYREVIDILAPLYLGQLKYLQLQYRSTGLSRIQICDVNDKKYNNI